VASKICEARHVSYKHFELSCIEPNGVLSRCKQYLPGPTSGMFEKMLEDDAKGGGKDGDESRALMAMLEQMGGGPGGAGIPPGGAC